MSDAARFKVVGETVECFCRIIVEDGRDCQVCRKVNRILNRSNSAWRASGVPMERSAWPQRFVWVEEAGVGPEIGQQWHCGSVFRFAELINGVGQCRCTLRGGWR